MGDFDCCPHDVGPEEDEMSRPDQDYTDLIADARVWPRDGVSKRPLINALADAIEALVKERDNAIRDLDARFEHSDHLSAKYYQRMRAAEREMHARELHHFEEEQKSAGLAAVIEKVKNLLAEASRFREADVDTWVNAHALKNVLYARQVREGEA